VLQAALGADGVAAQSVLPQTVSQLPGEHAQMTSAES
jgi:hypothetical protein